MPFFSIIIPTYNRKKLLKNTLESVFEQTYQDFEVIVIDDGSTDETHDWLATIDDARLKVIVQNNHGVAHARNRGIEAAQADWIAFLDSDDTWEPQKLERVAQFIKDFPQIKIFHTKEKWFHAGNLVKQLAKHKNPSGWVYLDVLEVCCISPSTAVVHKSIFDQIGTFDEDFPVCEDYDLWLRATHEYEVKLIEEELTLKDGNRADQLSFSVKGMDRFRVQALAKMLDSKNLTSEEYQKTLDQLKKKSDIYIKGAKKRGKNDEVAYFSELIKRFGDVYL